ncbi:MAG: transposase [Winogradskyella sp.]|uniref:transposase n=1 Tax=Winogradskyella sp. TaxID=1883156 RepID=UPI00385EC82E
MRNRKHNRMKGYDYSRDNLYFITICVDGMRYCLGDVVDGNADLNDNFDLNANADLNDNAVGTSRDLSVHKGDVQKSSQKIMKLNSFGEIVKAQLNWLENQYQYVVMHSEVVMPNHMHAILEIDRSLVSEKGVKIKSLSELVGAFKTTSSKLIRRSGFLEFKWKRSFHDHIIRNTKAYQHISDYIQNNPSKWDHDVFNKTC